MIVIERAESTDYLRLFQIFERARSLMTYLPIIHTKEETKNFITNLVRNGNVYLAKSKGKIVGFAEFKEGWINHLYVDPEYQSRGVGKELMDFAKEKSPDGLKLWVFEQNSKAIKFYEREGFELIEKRDEKNADNEENLPDRLYFWKAK